MTSRPSASTSGSEADAGEGAPWFLRLGAWVGIGTSPAALMSGGGAAQTVDRRWLWAAVLLGAVLLTALATAHALVGQRRGGTTIALTRRAFGSGAGPSVVALLIAVGTTLWTGFYLGVAAGALGYLLDVPAWTAAAPLGVILWAVHRGGFQRWNAVVALTGLTALAVAVLVFAGVPSAPSADDLPHGATTVLLGAGAIVAYAAVFSVRVPDFTHDAPAPRDVLLAAGALLLTLLVFLALGAGIFLRAGSWELADLVNRTAVPGAGAVLLVLAIIAPSVSGMHSAGLALEWLLGWSPERGAAASAVLAALLGGTRFDLQLLPFLGVLGAVVPPLLPVLLVRGIVASPRRASAWTAWVAWAAGSVVSLALMAADRPAHIVAGIAASAAVMLVASLVARIERSQR